MSLMKIEDMHSRFESALDIVAEKVEMPVAPPAQGSVIKVRGLVVEYNGRLQLRIEKLRAQEPADDVDMALLTPSAPEAPEAKLEELDARAALGTLERGMIE